MADVVRMIISIPPPFNMVIIIVAVVFSALTFMEFTKQIRLFFCHRQELEFKRELVDRGMGVDEIERVVRATHPPGPEQELESTQAYEG